MNYDVDAMTAAERPRKRILVSAVAVLLPVVALVGAAAWFVRSYVLPPTVSFESAAIASAVATPAAEPETTGTTGTSPPAAAPAVRYSSSSAEIWASVPIPGPPRSTQRLAPEPEVAVSEQIAAAVPLPPRRPQQSVNNANGAVPLPQPRPLAPN